MTAPVRLDRRGPVATITLDRPDSGNAIDEALADALLAAAGECADNQAVRVVVLTGAGRMFCAGGDIAGFAAAGEQVSALVDRLTGPLHAAIVRLTTMNKPLVTAVNGAAAGAGLGLAILGDYVLAARSAKFAAGYLGLGFTPDGGVSWLLPRLVGLRQAQRLALSGERINAAEALRIGLVSEIVDDAMLADATSAAANRLTALSGAALGATRALLRDGLEVSLEAHLDREARAIARSAGERHGREGVAAFLARRQPLFD